MTLKETELQREIHAMMQKMTDLEEVSGEKNRLTEELNLMSEEIKNSKVSFCDRLTIQHARSPCLFL